MSETIIELKRLLVSALIKEGVTSMNIEWEDVLDEPGSRDSREWSFKVKIEGRPGFFVKKVVDECAAEDSRNIDYAGNGPNQGCAEFE